MCPRSPAAPPDAGLVDETVSFRLAWPVVCRLAVKACCAGLSFEQLAVEALKDALASRAPAAGA